MAGEYAPPRMICMGRWCMESGNSTEAVYYLDTGIAGCLVVPDEFNVGYQSLDGGGGDSYTLFPLNALTGRFPTPSFAGYAVFQRKSGNHFTMSQ